MTIVLAGGSGFIGTQLSKKLLALGDTVVVVDKSAPRFTHEHLYYIQCDITETQLPFNVLEHTDAIINLVGAPINQKWTKEYKEIIRDSRIISTRHIVESIKETTARPPVFINASAVGYYGERGADTLNEKSEKGTGYLADVVAAWEAEAIEAEQYGVRVVMIRTAPVVGHGGLVAQIRQSARFGLLFSLSKRDFWQAWIHEEDIVNTYLFALQTTTLQGPVNAVAPEEVTHHAFMQTLATAMHRKLVGVLPRFIRTIVFGAELVDEITRSQRITPQLLLDKGFVFQHPTLREAMVDAVAPQV